MKNQDLWVELDRLTSMHEVAWHWVKGHAGNRLNERCDFLAAQASRAAQQNGYAALSKQAE